MKFHKNCLFFLIALLLLNPGLIASNIDFSPQSTGRKLGIDLEKIRYAASGARTPVTYKALGADYLISNSPGVEIGRTTWDFQAYGMNSRLVGWGDGGMIHFAFTKAESYSLDILSETRIGYQIWDCNEGDFVFDPVLACDVHQGTGSSYSRFSWLDVDTEGKALIAAYQMGATGTASTVWYDFEAGNCYFTPFKSRIPDSTMQYGCNPDEIFDDMWHFRWPTMSYQVFGGDTVTHLAAFQAQSAVQGRTQRYIHYFRRTGSDTLGSWDYPPMIIDTVSSLGVVVTSSRTSGKVTLVWSANPGSYPGDPESIDRFNLFGSEGVEWTGRKNDIYYLASDDMGLNWGEKVNVTAYDSAVGGWLADANISAMIDSDDYLHIVWNAREVVPSDEIYCDFTTFRGSRIFHWDELSDEVRTVRDANWPVTDPFSLCLGGYYNYSWLTKPIISECDGKFYTVFVQYHDIPSGIVDDCAETRYTGEGSPYSTANGEIYVSVSDNGGYNWDIARNLTNTYTPHCYSDESEGLPVCEADGYPSMPVYGLGSGDSLDFAGVPVVDPSGGNYTGDYYLDLLYINDKYPGPWDYDMVFTSNPMKWFRLACVDPVPNPVLVIEIDSIGPGVWIRPGVQLDTIVRLENQGNTPLQISSIMIDELSGENWLAVDNYGPVSVSHLSPNYYDLTVYLNAGGTYNTSPHFVSGYIIINSDSEGGSVDSIFAQLIIADTVQLPEQAIIKTECLMLALNNSGNLGDEQGGSNLNFIDDCDITGNILGDNNNSAIYIYDGSPYVARIIEGDTVVDYNMFRTNWMSDNGLRPLEGITIDTSSYPDLAYGRTHRITTHDSSIFLEEEFFAPSHPDSCKFIIIKLKIYADSGRVTDSFYTGDLIDWDIPSDDNKNKSGYDSTRNLFYIYGNEINPAATDNDNCVISNQRAGGYAFYGGYKLPYCSPEDSIGNPRSLWSHLNAEYIYPNGDFVQSEIYHMIDSIEGYVPWVSSQPAYPDSQYVDLFMAAVYGKHFLNTGDTLVYIKILASEYDAGLGGLQETIDRAHAWIENRPDIFGWPEFGGELCDCCDLPGDANDDSNVNILDITGIIAYLYKGGSAPVCLNEADVNNSCSVNILDITYLIAFLYKGGPAPTCGCISE